MSKHTYELYGGPLDGATTSTNKPLIEGDAVILDLRRTDPSAHGPDLTRVVGKVTHTWLDRTLRFTSMSLLDKITE